MGVSLPENSQSSRKQTTFQNNDLAQALKLDDFGWHSNSFIPYLGAVSLSVSSSLNRYNSTLSKLPLLTPASHKTILIQVQFSLFLIQLPVMPLKRQWIMARYLGPCCPAQRCRLDFWFLASACSRPGSCGCLESDALGEKSFSILFSPSPCRSSFWINPKELSTMCSN